MTVKPLKLLIVQGLFYDDLAEMLRVGAVQAAEAAGYKAAVISVPGALEIPAAIQFSHDIAPYDAYVALGCVLRGETSHYDIVAGESARALMDLTLKGLCIGNGILTCETEEQAIVRADPLRGNKGASAVHAALALRAIKAGIKA